MFNNPVGEKIPPIVQPEPPLVQLEALSSCPVTACLADEAPPVIDDQGMRRAQP